MRSLRILITICVAVLVAAGAAAAQTSPLLDDDLTEPSASFDESSGGETAVFEFSAGGMTVAAVNKGTGLYATPAALTESDALLSASVEVTATAESKKTGVGVFCRRSDVNGGYLAVVKGKKFGIYAHDQNNDLTKLEGGKSKSIDVGSENTIRLECERETPTSSSMILTLSINGDQVISLLESSAPNLGTVGLYLEGFDDTAALATFRDLLVEELPAT
jgi:hypothetical protein